MAIPLNNILNRSICRYLLACLLISIAGMWPNHSGCQTLRLQIVIVPHLLNTDTCWSSTSANLQKAQRPPMQPPTSVCLEEVSGDVEDDWDTDLSLASAIAKPGSTFFQSDGLSLHTDNMVFRVRKIYLHHRSFLC
jgi:hypothetical protein